MAGALRVVLEIGKGGRRVLAGATDWPGLDRWGKTEDAALETLAAYVDRYAEVAARAGAADAFADQTRPEVVERVPGSSSTDYWGIAHVPSQLEQEVLSDDELDRRLMLLEAAWGYSTLRLGSPRISGSGREVAAGRATISFATSMPTSPSSSRGRSRFGPRGRSSWTPMAEQRIGRRRSTRSAPTTPTAGRHEPGRSSS